MTEEIDTADRENTAGEKITKKNPGARTQDREDKDLCFSGAKLFNK
jgi:hypothetical protein